MAEYRVGGAQVTVSRSDRATPPLSGTFDVEIYGGRAEGRSEGEGACGPTADIRLDGGLTLLTYVTTEDHPYGLLYGRYTVSCPALSLSGLDDP